MRTNPNYYFYAKIDGDDRSYFFAPKRGVNHDDREGSFIFIGNAPDLALYAFREFLYDNYGVDFASEFDNASIDSMPKLDHGTRKDIGALRFEFASKKWHALDALNIDILEEDLLA